MKRIAGLLLIVVLCFGLSFSYAADDEFSFADLLALFFQVPSAHPEGEGFEKITEQQVTAGLSAWFWKDSTHEGYWTVGNDQDEAVKVLASEMDFENLKHYTMKDYLEFSWETPAEVNAARESGYKVIAVVDMGGKDMNQFFRHGKLFYRFSEGRLVMAGYPKFNYINQKELNWWRTFGLDLAYQIPFISPEYGANLYAVMTHGPEKDLGQSWGWVNRMDPSQLPPADSGFMSPNYIEGLDGVLKDGVFLKVAKTELTTNNHFVGGEDGQFSNGTAMGMGFVYPLTLTYYKTPSICERCEICTIHPDHPYCTEESCPDYGTKECGCYDPICENCNECSIDKTISDVCTGESCPHFGTEDCGCFSHPCDLCGECEVHGDDHCTEDSCDEFGSEECGCFDLCKICGYCHVKGAVNCTAASCVHFGTTSCGCYIAPAIVPGGACKDLIAWTETEAHTYKCPGEDCRTRHCRCVDENKKRTHCCCYDYCPGHPCTHTYTYQAALSTTAILNPATMKSGYGFSASLNNNVSVAQTGNSGACGKSLTKAYSKTVTPPTAAEARVNWTVTNQQKRVQQPKTIALVRTASTALTSTFGCAANPVSNHNNKLIYTNVAIAGTRERPVTHPVTLYTIGGGVGDVQFCKTLVRNITINGNMYEDDTTTDAW